MFGLMKSKAKAKGAPVVGASGKVETSNGLSKADKAEQKAGYARGAESRKKLQGDIALLESSLKKLLKHRQAGNNDDYSSAFLLRDKAQRMLDLLPGPDSRGAQKVLGNPYAAESKRLRYIVDEAQLVYDEHLVAMTKKKAGNIYMEAGKAGPKQGAPAKAGGLQKLTGGARAVVFDDLDPQAQRGRAHEIRDAGAALGLSPAETAAITTFTAEDYKYINPATANSDAWMRAANPNLIDKPKLDSDEKQKLKASFKEVKLGNARERMGERKEDLATRKEEGALHAGMAMQAFAKMPVWKGLTYRGEVLTQADFDAKFQTIVPGKKFKAKDKTLKRAAISSSSKDVMIARAFWLVAGGKVPHPQVRVLYEMKVTNGRDIEELSNSKHEKEVATLPGAEFSVDSVTGGDNGFFVLVKCKQKR